MDESKLLEIHAYRLTKDWKKGRIALNKPYLNKKQSVLSQMRLADEYLKLLQKPTIEKVKIIYGITGITLSSELSQNLVKMGNRQIVGGGIINQNISYILGIMMSNASYNKNSGIWKALIPLTVGNNKEYRRILQQLNKVIQRYYKIIDKYVSYVRINVKYQLYGGVEQWSSIPYVSIYNFTIPFWLLSNIGIDLNYTSISDYTNSSGIIEKILKIEITWK
jgi:hypothetical protein